MARISSRVSTNPGETEGEEFGPSLQYKVQQLEKTMKILRAEMEMKMKIMEQILNTRNDQFVVYRKLLDREEAIYQTVLAHWKNTSELASRGLFLHFSLDTADDPNEDAANESDERAVDYVTNTASKSSSFTRRLRKRKLRNRNIERSEERIYGKEFQGGSDEENGEEMVEDVGKNENDSEDVKFENLQFEVQDDSKKRKHEDLPASFSFQEEADLIEAVEKMPYLWDSGNKEYKNTKKKSNSWKFIARSFNKSVHDIQQCWVKLRQQYVGSLRKIRQGRMVNFRHSEKMVFIKVRHRAMTMRKGAKYSDGDGENSESNVDDSNSWLGQNVHSHVL